MKKSLVILLAIVMVCGLAISATALDVRSWGTGTNWNLEFRDQLFVNGEEEDALVRINIRSNGLNGSSIAYSVTLFINDVEDISVSFPEGMFGSGTFDAWLSISGYTVLVPVQGNDIGKKTDPTLETGIGAGHSWKVVEHKDATCEEDGFTQYECTQHSACRRSDIHTKLGHDLSSATVAATCLADGSITTTCSRCDYELVTPIAQREHIFNTVTVAAKCEMPGSVTTTCSRCDYLDVEVLPALGHDWVHVHYEPPTFTTPSYNDYKCTRCGENERIYGNPLNWEPATKADAYGTKIPSNAHMDILIDEGIKFLWGSVVDGNFVVGQQKEGGVLVIDELFFQNHSCLTIVIQTSGTVQFLKASITAPGSYLMEIPKWAKVEGKEFNINMVYVRYDDCSDEDCACHNK
jgi:hypothetical protein